MKFYSSGNNFTLALLVPNINSGLDSGYYVLSEEGGWAGPDGVVRSRLLTGRISACPNAPSTSTPFRPVGLFSQRVLGEVNFLKCHARRTREYHKEYMEVLKCNGPGLAIDGLEVPIYSSFNLFVARDIHKITKKTVYLKSSLFCDIQRVHHNCIHSSSS